MPASNRRYFRLGAAVLIIGGLGHLVLVDFLTLWTRHSGVFSPHRDVLQTMEQTTLSWGVLGRTIWFRAAAGFSFWLSCSLVLIGITYLQLSRQPQVRLAPFIFLGGVISCAFCAIASTCFIWPAALGGAAAAALFAASWLTGEA